MAYQGQYDNHFYALTLNQLISTINFLELHANQRSSILSFIFFISSFLFLGPAVLILFSISNLH